MRELDSEPLLASLQIEDNVLAILTRLRDRRAAIRKILEKIASLKEPARRAALDRFLVISNLRRLAPAIEEEAQKMPILDDIMDHEVLGPAIRKGMRQGRKEGLRDGMQVGRQEILGQQLQKRFGAIPKRIKTRLTTLSVPELDELALRLLDVATLDELFPRKG